ncbi:MAG: phosphate ABC transporter permease PstA [Proteobacteria bacterium]|nr:phosphate ABC transporter permease PstA [Pseudomonadota bacterium]
MAKGRWNRWRDAIVAVTTWTAAILVAVVFVWLLADIVIGGIAKLSWTFLTEAPRDAGRAGGIAPILVSTALILAVCMVASVPLSLATAILLAEFTPADGIFGRVVRRSLDVLAGVPSIVFGLFGYAFFCNTLGLGFSILSGGLTLACMVLPLLIRTTEEGMRSLSDDYRRAAAALGMTRTTTIFKVLLPAALPSLIVGLILSIGRASAETAALIFTSGYVDRMPSSLWDSGRAITVHILDLAINVPGGTENAYATALVLVMALLIINSVASWLGQRWLRRSIVR